MARSKSSRRWLKAHAADPYVRLAERAGYRSRAAFKLTEINERDRLLRPGMTVVDLGAAPGGWSQVAAAGVGRRGRVFALDRLAMEPLGGVEFIQGDFCEDEVLAALLERVGERGVDLVISDLAPNLSGMKAIDQPRAMYLAELALDFAQKVLAPGGGFLVKVFQGEGIDPYRAEIKRHFRTLLTRKPKASRPASRELYLLALNYDL